jgi:hypothetical protein
MLHCDGFAKSRVERVKEGPHVDASGMSVMPPYIAAEVIAPPKVSALLTRRPVVMVVRLQLARLVRAPGQD